MQWEHASRDGLEFYRLMQDGQSVAAIVRDEDTKTAIIATGTLSVDVIGDTLEQNKLTACTMLAVKTK